MRTSVTLQDILSLSPWLTILCGALFQLLFETFASEKLKRFSLTIPVVILSLATVAVLYAPNSDSSLLTSWIRFDGLTRFFNLLFISISFLTIFLSESFLDRNQLSKGEFFFLLLSGLFGLMIIGSSADFMTLFIGLETLSISLYILCAYQKKWGGSQESSVKYFFMGSIGAAFLLYGVALIYGSIGTTQFESMLTHFEGLNELSSRSLFLTGISLVTVGLAFKSAIVPFHFWAPDVYDGASNPVTAFMAVGTKTGAFAAFAILFIVTLPMFDLRWNQALTFLVYPTLVFANFVAIRQTQLRRFFAYSGISHAGYMLIPVIVGSHDAMIALLFYMVVYALSTIGSFAVLSILDNRGEGVMMSDLRGLFWRSPVTALFMTLCLLSLAGIPPIAGFFAKFYVFKVAFEAGYYAVVVVALLMAVLSAYYYMRIVALMFSDEPVQDKPLEYPKSILFVGLITGAGLVLLSIYPAILLNLLAKLS